MGGLQSLTLFPCLFTNLRYASLVLFLLYGACTESSTSIEKQPRITIAVISCLTSCA